MPDTHVLIQKIRNLPADRLGEIEDFVDFIVLKEQERALTRAVTTLSAPAFAAVWDNPDDVVYDEL